MTTANQIIKQSVELAKAAGWKNGYECPTKVSDKVIDSISNMLDANKVTNGSKLHIELSHYQPKDKHQDGILDLILGIVHMSGSVYGSLVMKPSTSLYTMYL